MNTTETNKKLAEFLGRDKIEMLSRYIVDDSWLTDEMADTYKFNSDWNWLMLVWKAIPSQTENYCFSPSFDMAEIVVYDKDGGKRITTIYCDKPFNSLIEMIYNLCSMFVDWYNKQKP